MEVITIVKDIVLIIASIVGSVATIIGLNTWKAQQKGKIAFELSRNLLAKTYKLREQINNLRSPYMSSAEMENPPEDNPLSSSSEGRHFYQQYTGYKKRLAPLEQTREEIFADLAEAEALWGREIRDKYNKLFDTVNELVVEINMFLTRLNPKNNLKMSDQNWDQKEKIIEMMYHGSKEDEYSKKINSLIEDIENEIRPHLKKQK